MVLVLKPCLVPPSPQPFMQPGLMAAEGSLQRTNGSGGDGPGGNSVEEEGEEMPNSAPTSKKRSRSDSGATSPRPQPKKRRVSKDASRRQSADGDGQGAASLSGSHPSSAPKVFTFDPQRVPQSQSAGGGVQDAETMTQRTATLDDLCRAVEELEKREQLKGGRVEEEESLSDEGKKRPENIVIPQSHSSPAIERERHRFGATPPYTPPPILSPARSMTMLSMATPIPPPGTPGRILAPWSSRRSSDNARGPSESEESYSEPRINIGKEFQAELPACDGEPRHSLTPHVPVCVCVSHVTCVCVFWCEGILSSCVCIMLASLAPALTSAFI